MNISDLTAEANSPKRRLMELYAKLETNGNFSAAEALDKIIARLEAWQNRYGK